MKNVILRIREELKANGDEKAKESGQRFFKEAVKMYGVKTALVTKIGKKYFSEIKNSSKAEIFNLCEQLWQSGYMDETFIACNWSYYIHKYYRKEDMEVFERWIKKYVSNWAACDTLCNHSVGTLLEMYPEKTVTLKEWTRSTNRWLKRAAAVSLIVPAKKGLFLPEILEISDALLTDTDDLVQKGYGWMLKAASQAQQKPIFDYVMKKKDKMPRTALRYAIEKMPRNLKIQAMEH
jgi:3-methyladenine DNA glycosylase AlkD